MYPPHALLRNAGIAIEAVRDRVGLADLRGVKVLPAPWFLRLLWIGDVAAMTLGRRIFVDPSLLRSGDHVRLGRLLVHELVHVGQWERLGWLRFLWTYLSEYLEARREGAGHDEAYRQISLEREAREAVASL